MRSVPVMLIAAVAASPTFIGAQRDADPAREAMQRPVGISGRVTDRSGVPVKDVFVTALYPEPQRRYGFVPVNAKLRAETDAQGAYVLENLSPGEYLVIAVPRNTPLDPQGRPSRTGYGNTFHPNSVRAADAARVRVTLGATTADITLAPARLAAITGVVLGDSGEPVRGGVVGLARGDGIFGLFSGGITIRPDGGFGVAGLQPGTYHLHYREGPLRPPPDEEQKISAATLKLDGADVTNVRVAPIRMVKGSGRVVIPADARSTLKRDGVVVASVPLDFDGNPGGQRPGPIADDLTFAFKTWPGVGRIVVSGLPPGWKMGAVRLNGVDVGEKGIEFAGTEVTGIEVELLRR